MEGETAQAQVELNPTTALLKRHVGSLQDARKSVEAMIQDEDREFPELYDLVGLSAATSLDYAMEQKAQFRLLKMIPLPETLHQMYKCTFYSPPPPQIRFSLEIAALGC
jgi:hypothetical protein